MSDKKNVELVFESNGEQVRVDAKAVAEWVRLSLCRGSMDFLGILDVEEEEKSNARIY